MQHIFKRALPLALAFTLAAFSGCRKKEEKVVFYTPPAVIEQMIQASVTLTDTCHIDTVRGEPFKNRLRPVLTACDPRDLKILQDNNVVIALDQRLHTLNNASFFYTTIEAIYYQTDGARVLSLWDNGQTRSSSEAFYTQASADAVHNLAQMFRDKKLPSADTLLLAGYFKDTRASHKLMLWKKPADFSGKSLKKNPGLLAPPLKPR